MKPQPRKGAEPSAISESCWPIIWLESNSRPTTAQGFLPPVTKSGQSGSWVSLVRIHRRDFITVAPAARGLPHWRSRAKLIERLVPFDVAITRS